VCEECKLKSQITDLENRIATLEHIEENRVRFGLIHDASPLCGGGTGWENK
jgi:hypothetical protein